MARTPFCAAVTPDWEGFVRCIRRQGTPARVHCYELFLDGEVQTAIALRYGVVDGLDPADPWFGWRRQIAIQRFLGYDYVSAGVDGVAMSFHYAATPDTAALPRAGGRNYLDEHRGPITSWAEFEAYPWPDVAQATTQSLEWLEKNLPDDMCVIGWGFGHFCEYLTWLMGYESLCFALYDDRELVQALADRILAQSLPLARTVAQFERVKLMLGSDDMGFRTGTLISPADTRRFVLPGHKAVAAIAHQSGRPYLLHSCGNLSEIMADLIQDVGLDAKHSFEDTIEDVRQAKQAYGQRLTLLGGIDLDFLCRATQAQVRQRVRDTLDVCQPNGGYALGTGNSVANYLPLDNYLAMLDEGRRYGG
ncbi:MAG: uroporphyrinogen decarboxylase family protein [Candidatus Latescibacterota bacterium]